MSGEDVGLLSVIVPAYGEGASIYASLIELFTALDELDVRYEVLVVSDGSKDNTVEEAARVEHHTVQVLHYDQNRGKGYALRHGFAHSRGDHVAFIDADMELHPSGIGRLLELLRELDVDAVIGTKTHPESAVHYPAFRRFQSGVYRRLVRLLFRLDVGDTQTGLKLFRRTALEEVVPFTRSDGFAFDLELLALLNAAGHDVAEGPVELDYRFATTTGLRAVIDVLTDTFRIAGRTWRLRRTAAWADRARRRGSSADGAR